MRRIRRVSPRGFALAAAAGLAAACGAKTGLEHEPPPGPDVPVAEPELCDGLDNDLDGDVDEEFRDAATGYYNHHDHCGRCGRSCSSAIDGAADAACSEIRRGVWTCIALTCESGLVPSADAARCVPWQPVMCLDCLDDDGCDVRGGVCARIGGEPRCTVECDPANPGAPCPDGYRCVATVCVPPGGSCSCGPGEFFTVSCRIETSGGEACMGTATCRDGALSACTGSDEICDGADNDCDGLTDEGFRDERGQYSIDPRNCGACGVDCTETVLPDGELVCGGDPYAPRCRMLCADESDGIQVGDHIDADLILANGCECRVGSLTDDAGPVGTRGGDLDADCDGADGDVPASFYVAPDGNDSNPGSPMLPLVTIGEGVRRARDSLSTGSPRADVFVAAGTYVEIVRIPDGVRLHGGYRNDFLALQPDSFVTAVVAPDWSSAPGGAALEIEDGAGVSPTVVEGIQFRGADAPGAGMPAFGAFVRAPGPPLLLRNLLVRAGRAGAGSHGIAGAAGASPARTAETGQPPRGAVEDILRSCVRGDANTVRGGAGAPNDCGGVDPRGGAGGSAVCPTFGSSQPAGETGRAGGPAAPGGAGGSGGWDCEGPMLGGPCPTWICCGLADFTVPYEYELAGDGDNGRDGAPGNAGGGCADPIGTMPGGTWTASTASAGTAGGPGGGGGGGGAGGGAVMNWYPTVCQYPDGLGGGGGGGGAGGCGGRGGSPGTSGAPSVGIVIDFGTPGPGGPGVPSFESVRIVAGDGGLGGRGGPGGDGGLGGPGAPGGDLPRNERTTPTLAGPTRGGHGGRGGNGGPGGGGGGGCGGSSIGVWALLRGNPDPGIARAVASGATVTPGRAGAGGRGGAGAAPGGDGADGVASDVVVQ